MIERHQRIYILSWSFIHQQNVFPAYISITYTHTQICSCRPHSEQKREEVTVSCGIPAVCLSLSMHFLFLCHTHTMTNTRGLSQSDRTLRSFQHVFWRRESHCNVEYPPYGQTHMESGPGEKGRFQTPVDH